MEDDLTQTALDADEQAGLWRYRIQRRGSGHIWTVVVNRSEHSHEDYSHEVYGWSLDRDGVGASHGTVGDHIPCGTREEAFNEALECLEAQERELMAAAH